MSENHSKNFLIFGNPVEHSKSPQMHNAAFEHINQECVYEKYLLENGKDLRKVFLSKNVAGANITVPHKETAYEQADVVEGIAKDIKAVNTYINKDGKIHAFNTDAPGFMKAIESFGEIQKVLIIGAGGTARALAFALKQANKEVCILNRSREKLVFFKEHGFKVFTWDSFQMDHFDLIVNSTSAGLKDDNYPTRKTMLEGIFMNAKNAFDCIYGKETPFQTLAKVEGLTVKDGEDMLLYQGVLAFEYFSEQKADETLVETMRQALKS